MKKIITIIILIIATNITSYSQKDSLKTEISQLKKNIIKIKPTSFVFGYTQITYERSLSQKRSFEINLGLIGLGKDYLFEKDPMGFAIRGGYKFYFGNRKIKNTTMKGLYLMPEIAYCLYDKNVKVAQRWTLFDGLIKTSNPIIVDQNGKKSYDRYRKHFTTIIGTIGYQWIIKRIVIDYNVGIGIGYHNNTRSHFGFIPGLEGNDHHFGFNGENEGKISGVANANLKIGLLF